jgi:hypothetical protein
MCTALKCQKSKTRNISFFVPIYLQLQHPNTDTYKGTSTGTKAVPVLPQGIRVPVPLLRI